MRRRAASPLDLLGLAALIIVTGFSLLLLIVPSLIVIAVSFEPRSYIAFPPQGFSLRWYASVFENRQLMDSVAVSIRAASFVMLIGLLLGVPAAFGTIRGSFR